MNIMKMSPTELREGFMRAKNAAKRVKEETREIAARAVESTAVVAGGAAAGIVWSKFGDGHHAYFNGTEIEIDLAGGVLITALGVAGFGGEYSGLLTSFGSGMLAANAAIMLAEALEKREKKTAA